MPEEPTKLSWQLMGEDAAAGAAGRLPGAHLKAAREAKGLAVEEIAEALHLHKRQIAALESDDYGYFSAPIFVTGYIRNYARLLGIDPEPLLASFGHHAPQAPAVRAELTATSIPMKRDRLTNPSWGVTALVATVVILLTVWALGRHPATKPSLEAETPAAAPSSEASSTSAPPAEPAGAASAEPEPASPALAPATGPSIRPSTPSNSAAGVEVVFTFKGDSWVEVSDATGRRLAARMGRMGDEVKLRGQPPFDVLLGNASAVAVEYNGQPYTRIPANRQNVATFKLGQPAAN